MSFSSNGYFRYTCTPELERLNARTFETSRRCGRRGRWKSFGRRWWADYYAIRAIVIQLLHSVTPVFAPRNYVDWNRERAAYCAARNSTCMQMIGRSTLFEFNLRTCVSCRCTPSLGKHSIVHCGGLFSAQFYGSRIGKRESRICGNGYLTVTGIIYCVSICVSIVFGGTFGNFYFSFLTSKKDLY